MKTNAKVFWVAGIMTAVLALGSCATVRDILDNALGRPGTISAPRATPEPTPEPAPVRANQPRDDAPPPVYAGPSSSQGRKINAGAELKKYGDVKAGPRKIGAGRDLVKNGAWADPKPGEWAMYRTLEDGKIISLVKIAILSVDRGVWSFEMVSYSSDGAVAFQMGASGFDKVMKGGKPEEMKTTWIKVKDQDGQISVIDGMMLGMVGGTYSGMVRPAPQVTSKVSPGGVITVPAGTFAGSWKVETEVASRNRNEKGTAWIHSDVPVWHMIRSESDSGRVVMELVDFGDSGYVSEF